MLPLPCELSPTMRCLTGRAVLESSASNPAGNDRRQQSFADGGKRIQAILIVGHAHSQSRRIGRPPARR